MARLDKLVILGCRSFGPEQNDQQSIKFFSPLTLILGENGCGKTTIIEALKVAACGEYPPGSDRGKLFVHDPKVAKATETRAQVKLRIFDPKDEIIEVTRSFTLTQRPKTLMFKSDDSTIKRIKKDGKDSAISLRCVDIDAQMCDILQVSKAILNFVIFCHQEESGWPLDEGKKLKERFDLIFESTKYNKCVEVMLKRRKIIKISADLLDKDITILKERKMELHQKRSEIERITRVIERNVEQDDDLNNQLAPINERLAVLAGKEANIVKISNEKASKEKELELLCRQESELLPKVGVEFAGSIDELTYEITSFIAKLAERERSKTSLQTQLDNLVRKEDRIQKTVSQEQMKLGQLQKEEELNKTNIEARNRDINRMIQDLNIQASQQTQMSEEAVEGLLTQVKKKLGDKNAEMEGLRSHLEFEEAELQAKVDNLRDAKSRVEHDLKTKRDELTRSRLDSRDVRKELDDVKLAAGKLALLEAKLASATRDLDDATESVDIDALKTAIAENAEEERSLDLRCEVINKEVAVLTAQSSTQAELDVGRKSLLEKEAEVAKLRNKHDDNLRVLFKQVPTTNYKYELQSKQDKLARGIRELTNQVHEKQRKLTTLEANFKHQKMQLRLKEEDLRQSEDKIMEHCGSRSYETTLNHVTDSIAMLQDKTGTMDASVVIYKRYVSKLELQDPCCPLCRRNFDAANQANELARELSDKIREVPIKLQATRAELTAMSEKYDTLQQLKPMHTKISQLRDTDIPQLQRELKATEASVKSARSDLDDLSASMSVPQTEEGMAREMSGDMALLDQHQAEARRLQRDIDSLEAKMPHGASGRSMQQALTEQEQLRSETLAARRAHQAAQAKLAKHSETVTRLRERKNQLVAEQLEIRGGLARTQELQNKMAVLQATMTALDDEIEALTNQVAPAKAQLDSAERERDDAKRKNRATVENLRTELGTYQRRLHDVTTLHQAAAEFERRGVRAKLAAVRVEIGTLERNVGVVRRDKDERTAKINAIARDIASQKVRERELEDNLRLRELRRDAEVLREQVDRLGGRLGTLDYRALVTERTRLAREQEKIEREKNQLDGRQAALKDSIESLKIDIAKEKYINVESAFSETYAKLMVKRKAIEDIGKFTKAVEMSMIRFHEVRMKNTNQIIRELWRQVYRGNDIDYIEIKTETPDAPSGARRQYQYRVVQMKGTTELDMRGRCSAGQKVLACLVIRIALAETFSARCGIFTLDEPTTNLDEQNIRSLSSALNELINARSQQKNFQLVIITHDAEFLETLTEGERVSHYYKIRRNDSGKSVIEKRRVADC